MSVLVEPYDVEIQGYGIGPGHEWFCTQIEIGALTYRTQDAARPRRDGRHFGRDFVEAGSWQLTLVPTGTAQGMEIIERLGRLSAAWSFDGRAVPGAYTVLSYMLEDGVRRRVFGRPRDFAPDVNGVADGGSQVVVTFDLMDATAYVESPNRLELELLPVPPTGLVFPAVAPFRFAGGGSSRQGIIHNAGSGPSPLRVTFSGPVDSPRIRSITHGWVIEVGATLAWDRWVVVDTRDRTVLRDDGASLAHTVGRHSDLGVMVAPGVDEIVFEGFDPTGTSRATVEWLTAVGSF